MDMVLDTLMPTEPIILSSVLRMLSLRPMHSTMVHTDLVSEFL
jgi:hypothetical protein